MNVLITGSNGFIGKNLKYRLLEKKEFKILEFNRGQSYEYLELVVKRSDFIVHLAGENRPDDINLFEKNNVELTKVLCDIILKQNKNIPILYSSTIKTVEDSIYGRTKLQAENILNDLHQNSSNKLYIYRLPNVFGKWCKPNYNSVVATFCYNIVNNLPITVHDKDINLNLVYIDDVIDIFIDVISKQPDSKFIQQVTPNYNIKLGELSNTIKEFSTAYSSVKVDDVGIGIKRALYATYISYKSASDFSYKLKGHTDPRGKFVEFLKTNKSGQISFFTAEPGITRGEHYHNTKNEKFLIIAGTGKFKLRCLNTDKIHELTISEDDLEVVETVPGWVHSLTNIGNDTLKVIVWANEVFNTSSPDTYQKKINE